MSEFLVTGGAGFIGSHIVEHLVGRGAKVRAIDNLSTGKAATIDLFRGKVDFIEGDIRDAATCRKACRGVRVVFHEAAMPSVPKSVADPLTSHDCNINGTFNMLMAARDEKVARFVYAASSSAYGESPTLPKLESMPTDPLTPYAVNKLAGEHYCRAFAEVYGMSTVALRYFNVFGPRQDPTSQYAAAIPAFITHIMRDQPPTIYGDGEQTRDFTYIENVVRGNMLAAEAKGLRGQVINLACGERVSVNRIIAQINKLLGKQVRPNHVDPRAGDIKHSQADITRARELLGFEPVVNFDDGLKRSIEWFKANL